MSVQARRVAIWVANGVDSKQANLAFAALRQAGANPRMVGPRIGLFKGSDDAEIEAVASLETEPGVLFDGMVVPSGTSGFINTFTGDGRAAEFIKDQYRHCKTILLVGKASEMLRVIGVPESNDAQDHGVILGAKGAANEVKQFIEQLAQHRHFSRESVPQLL